MSDLLNQLLKEQEDLMLMIKEITVSMPKAPKGYLRIAHKKTATQYYHVEEDANLGHIQTYIRKENKKLAYDLAQRDYDLLMLKIAKENLRTIQKFIKKYNSKELESIYAKLNPYRYEYPIVLPGLGNIYPDFTVLNVKERKELYWEHFGMMDNAEYSEKALYKIDVYTKNNLLPGDKLIITHETSKRPLETVIIETVIQKKLK